MMPIFKFRIRKKNKQRNCLILGFGRSGTSLMGGLLYHSGYFAGNNLHPARETNPKGFFEDIVINRINEQILEPYDYYKSHSKYPSYTLNYSPYVPSRGHRWLMLIDPTTDILCENEEILEQARKVILLRQPFAYKDPRFNFTWPVWEPYLPTDTKFICMFRHPAAVIRSVLHECKTADYLSEFYFDEELGFRVWHNSYRHLLDRMTENLEKRMLFIAYEDLVEGKCIGKIADFLNASIDAQFIEPSLNRTPSKALMPDFVAELYDELIIRSARD
jgi:hypothetical protein